MSTSWTNPRHDGAGTWTHTPRPAAVDWLLTFISCLLALILLVGLYVVLKVPLCAWHDQQLRFCPGYQAGETK